MSPLRGRERDRRSVADIEGVPWPAPGSEASFVVRRIHQLRQVPITELSIEDLRIMLSQNVRTAYLMPRVLDRLEHDPLSTGDFYPRDLLAAMLRLPANWWSSHLEWVAVGGRDRRRPRRPGMGTDRHRPHGHPHIRPHPPARRPLAGPGAEGIAPASVDS